MARTQLKQFFSNLLFPEGLGREDWLVDEFKKKIQKENSKIAVIIFLLRKWIQVIQYTTTEKK